VKLEREWQFMLSKTNKKMNIFLVKHNISFTQMKHCLSLKNIHFSKCFFFFI